MLNPMHTDTWTSIPECASQGPHILVRYKEECKQLVARVLRLYAEDDDAVGATTPFSSLSHSDVSKSCRNGASGLINAPRDETKLGMVP